MPPYTARALTYFRSATLEEWRRMPEHLRQRYIQGKLVHVDKSGQMSMGGPGLYSAAYMPDLRTDHYLVKARRLPELRRWYEQSFLDLLESLTLRKCCVVCGRNTEGMYGDKFPVCFQCYNEGNPPPLRVFLDKHPELADLVQQESIPVEHNRCVDTKAQP